MIVSIIASWLNSRLIHRKRLWLRMHPLPTAAFRLYDYIVCV